MKVDLGLYQSKYALRAVLARLPGLHRLDPNLVSLGALVPSALAAAALLAGWWPLIVIGIVGRMLLTTLDGHIAERYGKQTRLGAYLNRAPAEIGDVMLLLPLLAWAEPAWAAAAIGLAWLVNVFGLLGLVARGSIQSVGPAGQTDRLVLLLVASVLATVMPLDWNLVAMALVGLSVPTLALRARRSLKELNL
jgi:CDP-diacylglycerol--glycerol-3-phosphate 3-phosphatidyltransferase